MTDANDWKQLSAFTIPDPVEIIVVNNRSLSVLERSTLNCYSSYESNQVIGNGNCLPITTLRRQFDSSSSSSESLPESDVHTVDFEFSPPPLFAHFVRMDEGPWLQHQNP